MEIWRDPPPSLGLSKYEVSSRGQVRNKKTNRLISQRSANGYSTVTLYKDKDELEDKCKSKPYLVHRLVAFTFIANLENKPTVNHKNYDLEDNSVENLEWATSHEQNCHKRKVTSRAGRRVRLLTLNRTIVKEWDSIIAMHEELKIPLDKIHRYLGREETHHTHIFEYADLDLLPGEVFLPLNLGTRVIYVSDFGRVYRNSHISSGKLVANGYMGMRIDHKNYSVHRLIAVAFISVPDHLRHIHVDYLEVNHKDGNRVNNITTNLEWCTSSENVRHMYYVLGHGITYPVAKYNLVGQWQAEYPSLIEASRAIGVDSSHHIGECCRGERPSAYGFIWRFKGDPLGEVSENIRCRGGTIRFTLTGRYVATYSSLSEAARDVNSDASSIVKCCRGVRETAAGNVWRYREQLKQYYEVPVIQYSIYGMLINEFPTIFEASKVMDLNCEEIFYCSNGMLQYAGGWIWRYKT